MLLWAMKPTPQATANAENCARCSVSGDAKFDYVYKRPVATVCGDAKFDCMETSAPTQIGAVGTLSLAGSAGSKRAMKPTPQATISRAVRGYS